MSAIGVRLGGRSGCAHACPPVDQSGAEPASAAYLVAASPPRPSSRPATPATRHTPTGCFRRPDRLRRADPAAPGRVAGPTSGTRRARLLRRRRALLPPQLIALMIVLAHCPGQGRGRSLWHAQAFNIASWVCASLDRLLSAGPSSTNDPGQHLLAGAGGALAAWPASRQRRPARPDAPARPRHDLRETGLFSLSNLSTELGLAALGVGLAASGSWLPRSCRSSLPP